MYEAYQQRETETKTSNAKDMRNRFATLTSDWVNRPAIPAVQVEQLSSRAAPNFSAVRDAGPAHTSLPAASVATGAAARDAHAAGMQADAQGRQDADTGDGGVPRTGGQSNVLRTGSFAGVLSRSVGLVTSLAQHMRGLGSRRGNNEFAHSRNNSTNGSALLNELLQLDNKEACQQALAVASLNSNFTSGGVAPAAQHEMVEQMVKADVISSCATLAHAVLCTLLRVKCVLQIHSILSYSGCTTVFCCNPRSFPLFHSLQ